MKDRIVKKFIKKYVKLENQIKLIDPAKTQEYRAMLDKDKLDYFNLLISTHEDIEKQYHKCLRHIRSLKKQNEELRYDIKKLKKK